MRERGALTSSDGWRFAGIALVLLEGGIHLQQFEGILRSVPTINVLFVLNAVGAALIALVLAGDRDEAGVLAALSGIGLTIGALVSLAIARASILFEYSEPTLRGAVAFAAVVELLAVLALAGFIRARVAEGPAPTRHVRRPA